MHFVRESYTMVEEFLGMMSGECRYSDYLHPFLGHCGSGHQHQSGHDNDDLPSRVVEDYC